MRDTIETLVAVRFASFLRAENLRKFIEKKRVKRVILCEDKCNKKSTLL